MSHILHVTASIRGEESISNRLGKTLVEGLAAKSGASVTRRDLSANDVPYVSDERFAANLTAPDERNPEQAELAAFADTLIEELQAADTIVVSSPVYNFAMPATVKAWADLVARVGTTFRYTENGPEGLLTGKKAYITMASGGTPRGADFDFMSRWLEFFLGFLGLEVVETIAADGIQGVDADEKIAAAKARVAEIAG